MGNVPCELASGITSLMGKEETRGTLIFKSLLKRHNGDRKKSTMREQERETETDIFLVRCSSYSGKLAGLNRDSPQSLVTADFFL